jgi:hypothetical protein
MAGKISQPSTLCPEWRADLRNLVIAVLLFAAVGLLAISVLKLNNAAIDGLSALVPMILLAWLWTAHQSHKQADGKERKNRPGREPL